MSPAVERAGRAVILRWQVGRVSDLFMPLGGTLGTGLGRPAQLSVAIQLCMAKRHLRFRCSTGSCWLYSPRQARLLGRGAQWPSASPRTGGAVLTRGWPALCPGHASLFSSAGSVLLIPGGAQPPAGDRLMPVTSVSGAGVSCSSQQRSLCQPGPDPSSCSPRPPAVEG